MALASHASTAVVVSLVATLSGIGPLLAQEMQTAPRSPMSPGSAKILMAPTDRDRVLWGTSPPHIAQPATVFSPPTQSPDLSGLDAAAITLVAGGGADVVVSSRAGTELILQLYRPNQNQWQEFRVPPSTNTPITCASCDGKLTTARRTLETLGLRGREPAPKPPVPNLVEEEFAIDFAGRCPLSPPPKPREATTRRVDGEKYT